MKYFQIKWDDENNMLPKILNWYNSFDVRNIRGGKFHLIPARSLLYVESHENTFFPDVISFPYFLISETFKEGLELYEPDLKYKEIILVDGVYEIAELYYLPELPELDCLSDQAIYYNDNFYVKEVVLKKHKIEKTSLFRIKDKDSIIIRLDLVESVIRRGGRGFSLKEVKVEEIL